MTDPTKELFYLGVVEKMSTFVQSKVEDETPHIGQKKAEANMRNNAKKMMTPVVEMALNQGLDGFDILQSIHKGSEAARTKK